MLSMVHEVKVSNICLIICIKNGRALCKSQKINKLGEENSIVFDEILPYIDGHKGKRIF